MDDKVLENALAAARSERATLFSMITDWGKHNSQSNPSAVAELRELKKELAEVEERIKRLERAVSASG